MYQILLFTDFPDCRRPFIKLDRGDNRRVLENKCRAFFHDNIDPHIMLCIVRVATGEVVYPVISSGEDDGTQEHPRNDRGAGVGQGWDWHAEANQTQNHQAFTAKLKQRQPEKHWNF